MSVTDPDARSMATHDKGSGVVGYNVQAAVDIQLANKGIHHLLIAEQF